MPTRYICRECEKMEEKEQMCWSCEEEMEEIHYPWTLYALTPYISASIAGLLLLFSYALSMPLLIWFTFPLIAAGLIVDHFYEKKIDEKTKDIIKKDKSY